MLDKLMWLFKKIKQYPGLALIWRPHPLLRSTIESMRPQLLMQYEELIAYFQENGVGVFDTTPDITSTVALSDGYIGELSTSVVNLFGAAGKPMLILDDYITEDITPEERLRFPIQDLCEKDGVIYALSQRYNGLFRISKRPETNRTDSKNFGSAEVADGWLLVCRTWWGSVSLSIYDEQFLLFWTIKKI